jgi:magnesium transporter
MPQRGFTSEKLDEPVELTMNTNFLAVKRDETITGILQRTRTSALGDRIVYFYVVDEDGRLMGVIPTRRLLMAAPEVRAKDIMVSRVVSLRKDTKLADACDAFLHHRFLAFPVVDADDRLVGVVDATVFTGELSGLAEKHSQDDVFQLIGVHLRARFSAIAAYRERFSWLLTNIAGGLICALLAGFFEDLLDSLVVLALFIPIVLALAESVSIQSLTLTLHRLHDRMPDWGGFARDLGREAVTALLLGLSCGTLVGVIAWAWKGDKLIALAIGISIMLAMLTACLFGVLLPTILRILRSDPKVAAGPIVLVCADIATLVFYFNLSAKLLEEMK